MARKKDEEVKDEPLEDEEGAADDGGEEELLPEAAPAAPRGGSGAFIAIVVVFVVIVLAVAAYMHREKTSREEKERRDQQMQVVGTQLGAVKANVAQALKRIDDDPPNVEGAMEALNTAAAQLGEMALAPSTTEAGLSPQLVDLQGQMRTVAQALEARNTQYEEAVAAAQRDLKAGAQDDVKPVAAKLDTLITGAYGDADTPLRVPGVSSVPAEEEATEPAATEPKDETKSP